MADKKPTYWELLQHPNWQRKRLEVLNRSNFECEDCGSTEKTLNVHHSYYERGLKPWDYPTESLHCLCVGCHAKAQDWMALMNRQIGRLSLSDLPVLYGFALALENDRDGNDEPLEVTSYEVAEGIALFVGTNADFVIHHLIDRSITLTAIREHLYEWRKTAYERRDKS